MDIKMGAIVLDSDNSEALSDFYSSLLGWEKIRYDEEWIIVKSEKDEGTPLVFQQAEHYLRPVWPAEKDSQQQMLHLDFYVDEVAPAVEYALSLGAALSPVQLVDYWRVLLDPAGHPFCILPNKPPDGN
ncbi:MAG: hypothetical protein LBU86_04295 [Oscillospiraceae bacterium]|jgi:catechol 2,3-dioxygenase-like lactoylglutathione lyase family enzyme|nr:hypothetical protein [Oscillospiraceae bacterium]